MIRGTTPTFILLLAGVDLNDCHSIHVTFRQKQTVVDTEDFVREGNQLSVWLSQETSMQFNRSSPIELQVNGLTSNNTRWATEVQEIDVKEQLLREVIT